MIPERTAAISAMPTVPMIHFRCLSFAVIYGRKSSVPGMIRNQARNPAHRSGHIRKEVHRSDSPEGTDF